MQKIVTNEKGLYAIRRGIWPFHRYFDLESPGHWWRKTSRFYPHCWGQRDKVEVWFGILNPKIALVILNSNDKQLTG